MDSYTLSEPTFFTTTENPCWFVHDLSDGAKGNLKKHVVEDDYFGMTASFLDLIKERFIWDEKNKLGYYYALEEIVEELLYLQKHYCIKKDICLAEKLEQLMKEIEEK